MHPSQGSDHLGRIRVYLVDDHPIVRSGLEALLSSEEDMVVVGEAGDGLAAVQGARATAPDVVVMDLSMPKLGGVQATERIRAECPEAKVLALSAHCERSYVQVVLAAGASGFLVKRAAADELVRAVRAVAAGGVYLDPLAAVHVVDPSQGTSRTHAQLSERETEVLRLIAAGHAMKEIAVQLDVSPRTLETYRARAMEKLGLSSRVDIVRYALQRGWLAAG
jgi:DNA-binding NarL/FixJ family response regulator